MNYYQKRKRKRQRVQKIKMFGKGQIRKVLKNIETNEIVYVCVFVSERDGEWLDHLYANTVGAVAGKWEQLLFQLTGLWRISTEGLLLFTWGWSEGRSRKVDVQPTHQSKCTLGSFSEPIGSQPFSVHVTHLRADSSPSIGLFEVNTNFSPDCIETGFWGNFIIAYELLNLIFMRVFREIFFTILYSSGFC